MKKERKSLQPLIVRAYKSDFVQFKDFNVETTKYEILAGHNRWNAATIAGIAEVPIVVMEDLTDEDAMLVVIETNLLQRSFADLSYSERALVISEHYKSLKSQGRRRDIINQVKEILETNDFNNEDGTCGHDVHKSRDQVILMKRKHTERDGNGIRETERTLVRSSGGREELGKYGQPNPIRQSSHEVLGRGKASGAAGEDVEGRTHKESKRYDGSVPSQTEDSRSGEGNRTQGSGIQLTLDLGKLNNDMKKEEA